MHRRRIARGARWLDKHEPEWYKRVDTDLLNPNSDIDCAFGQVFGSFQDTMDRRYFLPDTESNWIVLHPGAWIGLQFAILHGLFVLRETDDQWRRAWTEEVQKRINDSATTDNLFVPVGWEKEEELHKV